MKHVTPTHDIRLIPRNDGTFCLANRLVLFCRLHGSEHELVFRLVLWYCMTPRATVKTGEPGTAAKYPANFLCLDLSQAGCKEKITLHLARFLPHGLELLSLAPFGE